MSTTIASRLANPELVQQLVREVRQQLVGHRHPKPLVIGVRAQPEWLGGDLVDVSGTVRVAPCPTPLAAREAVAEFGATDGGRSGADTLVILTDLSEADLGNDLLGRFVRPRLMFLNSWKAVCQRLGVRQLDPDYGTSRLAWMAEALLSVPAERLRPGTGTLSVDAGLELLARQLLQAEGITLDQVLLATSVHHFPSILAQADPEVLANLCDVLGERLGPTGAIVTAMIANGRGADALPAGLAAATVAGGGAEQYAHALIEALTGQDQLSDAALSAWARASEQALATLEDAHDPHVSDHLFVGSEFVRDWRSPHPERSAVLPAGFEARLGALARELTGLLDGSADADLTSVRYAVAQVRDHREARNRLSKHRAVRAELAARLALWLRDPASAGHGTGAHQEGPAFATVLAGYLDDGAWVDAARRRVEEGDDQPAELASVLSRISEAAYERRREGNTRFAHALASWSEHGTATDLPDGPVRAVESILAEVAVPLASRERALLVVLDGCGVAQFLEFVDQFRLLGLEEIGPEGCRGAALAVLPTVTELSRSSLLCGALSPGNADHEKRGFAADPAVRQLPGPAARLFHHRPDLVSGVGQGLPAPVVAALAADGPRLVGAVVNTIDDELSRGDFTREYTVENLGPLQSLLRAAADAGRYVIVTGDHGHVLGVGLDGRGESRRGGEGGDRWRDADRALEPDEVLLRGPRVLRGGDRGVIAPAQDDLRYSAKHGGYHGGATPEECLVPLSVFRPAGVDLPPGWEPVAVAPPGWWDLAAVPVEDAPAPRPRKRRTAPADNQGDLFDFAALVLSEADAETTVAATPTSTATAGPPWIDLLLRSEIYAVQLGAMSRAKPPDDRVRAALGALHARGGTASFAVLTKATAMPATRIPGFLAALERLLNVDGYGVITVDRSAQEVRLDVDLLRTQFLDGST